MSRGVILLENFVNLKEAQNVTLQNFDVTVPINLVLKRN